MDKGDDIFVGLPSSVQLFGVFYSQTIWHTFIVLNYKQHTNPRDAHMNLIDDAVATRVYAKHCAEN